MGVAKEQLDSRKSKRAAGRKRNLQSGKKVSWGDVDPESLIACLHEVTGKGGALRLGHTRDHGAWALGIYGDGPEPYTEYVRPDENFSAYLDDLAQFFREMTDPEK